LIILLNLRSDTKNWGLPGGSAELFERMAFSARSFDKILKVSRTIADLEGEEQIKKEHILEALSFRKNN
jgi:predicted ATPase with chaperone activity